MRPPPTWLADGLGAVASGPGLGGVSRLSMPAVSAQQVEETGRLLDEDDARQWDLAQQLRVETGPQYAQQPVGVRGVHGAPCVGGTACVPGCPTAAATPLLTRSSHPSGHPSCRWCSTASSRAWWRSGCSPARCSPSAACSPRSTARGPQSTTPSSSGATTHSTSLNPHAASAHRSPGCGGQGEALPKAAAHNHLFPLTRLAYNSPYLRPCPAVTKHP
jgi:hypothetical protein